MKYRIWDGNGPRDHFGDGFTAPSLPSILSPYCGYRLKYGMGLFEV